jgi:hypothetical protein
MRGVRKERDAFVSLLLALLAVLLIASSERAAFDTAPPS